MTTEPSIQDRYFPSLRCFGCGPANERGLRIKSYPNDDGSVRLRFMPSPEHDNGLGYLNGGIIATVLDCHSAAAVMHESVLRGIVTEQPGQELGLQYVTAGLDVRYLRPAPLHETLDLAASVVEADDDAMTVRAEIVWDGKLRATVQALWKRWRPRD